MGYINNDHLPIPGINGYGQVTNDSAAVILCTNTKNSVVLKVRSVSLIVNQAAKGGEGIIQLRGDGIPFLSVPVNNEKVIPPIDFGSDGLALPAGVGIDAVVSGANIRQASVTIAVTAFRTKA